MTIMLRNVAAALLLASLAVSASARPATARAPMLGTTQFACDSLSTSQRLDPATLRDLGPAHSLDAAAAVLTKHGVKFVRSQGVLDVATVGNRVLRDIATLPQGEPIILPNGEGSAICVLRPSEDSI